MALGNPAHEHCRLGEGVRAGVDASERLEGGRHDLLNEAWLTLGPGPATKIAQRQGVEVGCYCCRQPDLADGRLRVGLANVERLLQEHLHPAKEVSKGTG